MPIGIFSKDARQTEKITALYRSPPALRKIYLCSL